MFRCLVLFISIVLFSSCDFNKLFLHPYPIAAKEKQYVLRTKNDSTIVKFSTPNYQPLFSHYSKDTLKLDFTIESVVFKSSNGNLLNGWLLKPKTNAIPVTLLHFHGNAANLIHQYKTISPLTKFGYSIFLFDYSGFGFSEGKATRKNVLKDGLSALEYVKSRGDLKNNKLIIYGHSLGGHLAAVIAAQKQNEIDGLVIEGAFSSHKDIAAEMAGILGRIMVKEQYCAYKSIRQYKKPVLVIHSTQDETIPFKMGQKIFDNANTPKKFYSIEKCHICGPRFYTDSIANKIQALIR